MASISIFVQFLTTVQVGLLLGMFVALAWGVREFWSGRSLLPSTPARVVPWKGLDVFGVVFLLAIINVVAAAVFVGGKSKDSPDQAKPAVFVEKKDSRLTPQKKAEAAPSGSIVAPMMAMTCVNAVLVVSIPLLLRWTCGATLEDIGISSKNLARNVQLGFGAFLLATPLVYVVFGLAQLIWRPNKHPLELMMMKEMSPGVVVLAFVSAVIFAPLAEELIFRSVLQGWLTRWLRRMLGSQSIPAATNGLWLETAEPRGVAESTSFGRGDRRPELLAVGITSALFALAHAPQMPAPVALFTLSVVLGELINRTGSLIPSIVVHACFNGFSTLGLLIRAMTPES